jgi:hypothetical protein
MANQRGASAMVMLSSPLIAPNAGACELALRHRFPAITLFPDFARLEAYWLMGQIYSACIS